VAQIEAFYRKGEGRGRPPVGLERMRRMYVAQPREGTVVEATIIAAPSSPQNQKGERNPGRHPAKKGNPWHFGMKAHMGAEVHNRAWFIRS
jgi:IS5 family transposase